jgi:hypothetical protein
LLPDGWQIVNPGAPAFVTREQALRWGGAITVGQPLKADMGAYWEVPLSPQNTSVLAQMDVIYLPIGRNGITHFTEAQRQLLALLADGGVTIWLDWAVNGPTPDNALGGAQPLKNMFFTNLDTASGAGQAPPPTVGHPLLDAQYAISLTDAPLIGSDPAGVYPGTPSQGRALETRMPDVQMTANFSAVVPTTGTALTHAYIAAARYGAGFVVGTAGNTGRAIAGMIAPNIPRWTNQDEGLAELEDLRFAFNVFAWRAEVSAQQKNNRHTGQSSVQINGMIEQATYPHLLRPAAAGQPWLAYPPASLPPANMPVNPVAPLIVNGIVISYTRYVDGQGNARSELNAFDADGTLDFNNDGFIDDPINATTPPTNTLADISIGQSYDRHQTLGPDSGIGNLPLVLGMTVGEVPEGITQNSPQGAKAFVFVAGAQGGASPTGLFMAPVPRPGNPVVNPWLGADYWQQPGVVTAAPSLNINYAGAPGFANIPGAPGQVLSQLYAGGQRAGGIFGGAFNGKIAAFDVVFNPNPGLAPSWYYPPDQESNRMGAVSGPVVTAQLQDVGTGCVDTMVITTSISSGDVTGAQGGPNAGDTTGKVEGWIVATRGDLLAFPQGNNAPGGGNPQAGRRFVSARWLNVTPGAGVVPQPRELMWDPNKHFEVRVMDKDRNYVLARFRRGDPGINLLPDGTGGQVELPQPIGPLAGFAVPGNANVWDLSRFVLLADYSPLPMDVDVGGRTLRPRFSPSTPYFRGQNNQVQPTGVGGGVAVGRDNLVYYGTGQGYLCASEWRRGRAGFRWKMRGAFGDYQDGTGLSQVVDPTQANYLQDYAFTAAPAAGDRIVFASKGRGSNGTAYVFEPDSVIRFKLNPSTDDLGNVQPPILQLTAARAKDLMLEADHGQGFQPTSRFLLSEQQPYGRAPFQFRVDPDTMTITFENMENFSLDMTQARSPQQLAAIGIDTGGKPAVPIRWGFRTADMSRPTDPIVTGSGATGPRVAWVPLPLVFVYNTTVTGYGPEIFKTGAVISGDRVYLMGDSGYLHELPLDPKTVDPTFPRPAPGLDGFNIGNLALYPPNGIRKLRNVSFTGPAAGEARYNPPPAVGQGLVAVSSTRGLTMYNSPNVIVTDANRVIEASGDSHALASTDVVTKHQFVQNDFPIPTDPAFVDGMGNPVQIIQQRKLLSRPAVVRKLDSRSSLTSMFASSAPTIPAQSGDPTGGITENSELAQESYIAADTGNNRVVEFNIAGKVVWEAEGFQDPGGLLPAGEPLKLNGPMDVQRWVERENHPTLGVLWVVHTLIADTGNNRVLQLVDKVSPQSKGSFNTYSYALTPNQVGVDGSPIRWYHVLVWASQTNAQGLRLRYRSAQRIFWTNETGTPFQLVVNFQQATAAEGAFPYLPPERFLSYTMASVTGQQVYYPEAAPNQIVRQQYNQFWQAPTQAMLDRIPLVRPGGDSIVFLRGRRKIDEQTQFNQPGMSVPVPFREQRMDLAGNPVGGETYRYAQGVVDPNVPIITEIHDEWTSGAGSQPASLNVVHRLNGVSSIHRTVRADVKFAPGEATGAGPMVRGQYFLIADTDGVWEFRMLPGQLVPPPQQPGQTPRQFPLTFAFTNEDYAYVTGAGNGDPALLYTGPHTPGGRRFTATSARRMPNGLVLVTSRTPMNEQPGLDATTPMTQELNRNLHVGSDVFLLRSAHYTTATERLLLGAPAPYNRANVLFHGWRPDQWVQTRFAGAVPAALQGAPSIRWRAAEALDPAATPTLRTQLQTLPSPLNNPHELTGSYIPVQPNYADLVY